MDDPDSCEWHSLDRRFITAERIGGWIFAAVVAVLSGAAGVAMLVLNWPAGPFTYATIVGLLVVVLALMWLAHAFPEIAFRYTHYRLGALGLEIRRGVLWRVRITVPLSRVQHTDVAQGPLQRKLSLATLVVYTAGTQNAAVELSGLHIDVASRLRDALVTGRESMQHG